MTGGRNLALQMLQQNFLQTYYEPLFKKHHHYSYSNPHRHPPPHHHISSFLKYEFLFLCKLGVLCFLRSPARKGATCLPIFAGVLHLRLWWGILPPLLKYGYLANDLQLFFVQKAFTTSHPQPFQKTFIYIHNTYYTSLKR